MNRNEARVVIMTILYQIFMYQKNNINYDTNDVIKENAKIDNDFIKKMVNGVLEKKKNYLTRLIVI